MAEYRILAWNPTDGHATIQFRGLWPFNWPVPILNGRYVDGDAFEAWVQSLHPDAQDVDFAQIHGGEAIAARVVREAWPAHDAPAADVQRLIDAEGFDEL